MSSKITQKTLNDLEFNTVINSISDYCSSNLGRQLVLKITPISAKLTLLEELNLVNEYVASFENENKVPNHHFEEITTQLHLLSIDDSFLEAAAFQDIVSISNTSNALLVFLKNLRNTIQRYSK